MAPLPQTGCPTLDAADRALEAAQEAGRRPYLGMSEVGNECLRALWYGFRWATAKRFDAATLKRFADGHRSEDVIISYLKLAPGIELLDRDPDTGRQFGCVDHDGHFRGHLDGKIHGVLQAPATWHVFEAKACNEKKIAKLRDLKSSIGEKNALQSWDEVYFVQHQLYMHYTGLTRGYLVAATPGVRDWVSVRTDYQIDVALRHIARAKNVIEAQEPPARSWTDPAWFKCRWCDHAELCHGSAFAQRNCRTCLHSTPVANGEWNCAKHDGNPPTEFQRQGCEDHRFIPGLVPGEQVDAAEDASWVSYNLKDGTNWVD